MILILVFFENFKNVINADIINVGLGCEGKEN